MSGNCCVDKGSVNHESLKLLIRTEYNLRLDGFSIKMYFYVSALYRFLARKIKMRVSPLVPSRLSFSVLFTVGFKPEEIQLEKLVKLK